MIQLTERERMLRTYRREEIDRIMMVDSAWNGTVRRWRAEGMPDGVDWRDYFGFDKPVMIGFDNSPRFETKVLEKTDRYTIETTKWGVTRKVFNELDSTPDNLHYYYDDSQKWAEAREKMLIYDPSRIPWKTLEENYARWRAEGRFMQLVLWFGFDVAHSWMIGTENLLVGMYDEPEWVTDVFDTYLTSTLELAQRVLDAGYEFDGVFWYDDMGYKGAPFFSPTLYRELLKPYHKKAADWAHERGMVVEMHSCGFIEPLIPDIIETGVEMLNPLEVKAGMDPFKLKNLYGDKLAFHGGINAQIWNDLDRVKAEMERIIPAMKEGGGYVFASDHSIPSSVSFENMKEIAALAHKLGKY